MSTISVLLLLSHQVVSDSFATPWTGALQAPLSMAVPRQEYWSWLLFAPPGDHPHPGIKLMSLTSALSGRFFTTHATWEAPYAYIDIFICFGRKCSCIKFSGNWFLYILV